jgi:hypothetical protein
VAEVMSVAKFASFLDGIDLELTVEQVFGWLKMKAE